MLEVSNLDLVYGNSYQVLWDASLRVDAGEIVCILGPNGAGKSSLMNTISGLRRPTRGPSASRARRSAACSRTGS